MLSEQSQGNPGSKPGAGGPQGSVAATPNRRSIVSSGSRLPSTAVRPYPVTVAVAGRPERRSTFDKVAKEASITLGVGTIG
jgi:hypothetical protein